MMTTLRLLGILRPTFKKYAMNRHIEPKYHDFITKEGLRFALYTDFS